jgi:hypothetical protein
MSDLCSACLNGGRMCRSCIIVAWSDAAKERDEARRVARETLLWADDFIANICVDEEWDAYREEMEGKHPWLRGELAETGE